MTWFDERSETSPSYRGEGVAMVKMFQSILQGQAAARRRW